MESDIEIYVRILINTEAELFIIYRQGIWAAPGHKNDITSNITADMA